MLQLGFVSAILPELSLDEVLGFASSAGFACVEVMCWPVGKAERRYAGVTHIDVAGFSPQQASEVHALVAKHKVTISALGYYPNPLTPDLHERATYVDHIKAVIDATAVLGLPTMNTFIGRDHTKSIQANWPAFKEVWPPIIAHAATKGVNVGIENCPMLFTDDEWPGGKNLAISPAVWRQMFIDIPDAHFGLNYDPSHMIWQHMDEVEPIREFAARLHHVHAKDVRLNERGLNDEGIMSTPLRYHTPKLPGLGDVRWGAFFAALTDAGYRGPVCIEAEDRAYEGSLEDRQRGLIQAARFLRQFMD